MGWWDTQQAGFSEGFITTHHMLAVFVLQEYATSGKAACDSPRWISRRRSTAWNTIVCCWVSPDKALHLIVLLFFRRFT